MRRRIYLLLAIIFFLAGCGSTASSAIKTPIGQAPIQALSTSTPSQVPIQSLNTPTSQPIATATTVPMPISSVAGLHLPPGFQMSIYARNLKTPRFTVIGPNGSLLVANRGAGSIVAVLPGSSPLQSSKTITLLSGLNDPTSLDLYNGYLYVGEQTSIARVSLSNSLQVGPIDNIITGLPAGGEHNTRTVLIGPDNHIYVSIGSDCNVCIETDPHRAAIWVYNMDGSQGRLYAKGLRNAVGLAINPWNQQIWITVNGRDDMGDNLPPDTLYNLVDQGDYGWPRCHAGTIHDPQYGQAADACQGVQQPLVDLQAHSAPLGLAFYPPNESQFPSADQNSLYIAYHGSWDRTIPTGYKIVRIPLKNGQIAGPPEDFITGWLLSNNGNIGRPVGVTFAPDGTLFISDDNSNVIYHVWYRG